jgi:hypothetical protein
MAAGVWAQKWHTLCSTYPKQFSRCERWLQRRSCHGNAAYLCATFELRAGGGFFLPEELQTWRS